ncbi:hypothetical protein SmJEL517_g03329 [Synchytrium microbalum]|uniref:Extracellular metalloproteinase n=1 Tax=Synchytrium microbalum TaxID=1806994 RepID=A0A507C755_9FUNG|nr:uncharacterized protein SmJEL517_g03329 [Synchytrium microbalum]TPX33826.1 hypothetical protein SmJEL517_g03329 [Synchytrium microbalum]
MKQHLLTLLLLGSTAALTTPSNTGRNAHRRASFAPTVPQLHEHGLFHNAQTPLLQSFLPFQRNLANINIPDKSTNPVDIAKLYASERLGVSLDSISVTSSHVSSHTGVTHVYLQQLQGDLEIVNGVANVNIDRDGRVISFGSSFYTSDTADDEEVTGFLTVQSDKAIKLKSVESERVTTNPGSSASDAVMALARFLEVDVDEVVEVAVDSSYVEKRSAGTSKKYRKKKHAKAATSNDDDGTNDDTQAKPHTIIKAPQLAVSDIPARLKYIQTSEGTLKLVWDLEVEMVDSWYHAHIDTESGSVISLIDWVSDASYNVFPLGTNSPNDGERVSVQNPANQLASPLGWHDQDQNKRFTKTLGNNVFAQENLEGRNNWENNYRPDGGGNLEFNYKLDLGREPSHYIDTAVTNLFYWVNALHDLFYVYGFDEKSGNFQEENFGRGGRGSDAVVANAQDGSGYNNANFATPPDGQRGRMRMYVWDITHPNRDGDLEGGIIVHEYSHGMTIRLTGGPANSGCLGFGESGGMGEGWGDFIATVLRMTPDTTRNDDFDMGSYANGGSGIRKFKYSTSKSTNPSTYGYIQKPGYWGVHQKGEVWAEILFEVYWSLLDVHGFDSNWFDTPLNDQSTDDDTYLDFRTGQHISKRSHKDDKEDNHDDDDESATNHKKKPQERYPTHPPPKKPLSGNVLALQLVIDGLKLQNCNPSFVDARDAILLADNQMTGGANACVLWKGFATRGLGKSARSGGHEAFDLPVGC